MMLQELRRWGPNGTGEQAVNFSLSSSKTLVVTDSHWSRPLY